MNKKLIKITRNIGAAALLLAFGSCDHNAVFEYNDDCDPVFKVNFVYDMNLKWADAFPSEVHSVNLYVFDKNERFVKEYKVNGNQVDEPGFEITLDLNPGDYTLLAWCGLDNINASNDSFTVISPVVGQTTLDEMSCSLNTQIVDGKTVSDQQIQFMYHGLLNVNLPDVLDGKTYYYTVPLTKDTNHIRIILQQLSGEDMNPDDFAFRIEAPNGEMAYDNSLLGNTMVNYLSWDKFSDEAGIFESENNMEEGNLVYADGVIADLSTCRMMADQANVMKLTIYNSEKDEVIASVPLIQYALMAKKYYESAYGHQMSDQEFLDREDEYILTFFLDESQKWINAYIYINSWRIVPKEYEFQ